MQPTVPAQIGRYPIVRELGSGAMGRVYLGRDPELDRPVAIKTVQAKLGDSHEREAFLVRFRNEARAVGRLRHPSVVAVYDVGTDPEVGPYLVFEYVEGSTLKDILRARGPLDPHTLLALAEQVASALDAAHRAGIIHRDIKPDNLLVGRDGRTRLADFGVARVPDAVLTGEGQFLGTPCYGAPETLQGGDYTPASDLFSLAAVLYEAVSGVRAFGGSDAVAVAHSVIHEQPRPVSRVARSGVEIPPGVDEVLARGLSKAPAERYPSAGALVAALRAAYAAAGVVEQVELADTLPGSQVLASASARPRRAGRRPFVWLLAGGLAVGVAVVAYFAPRAPALPPDVETDAGVPLVGDVTKQAPVVVGDAGPERDAGDANAKLARQPAPDAGAAARLSAFEREERAKDALDRARSALAEGDKAAAAGALDEAYRYDPGHPDIPVLRAQL